MECERLDSGNGHRLAQRLSGLVLIELLPKNQRKLYDCLDDSFQSAKELADKIGVHTKEISPQIKQINTKGNLVVVKTKDGVVKYKKA